ncbi:zinc ribbon domain-containing protein [Oxalobacteraceae sp. CFBP 13730]|nr:zinc ribbon domain-containing protein [Oxalobacteraceae sp. CFBP 13730]
MFCSHCGAPMAPDAAACAVCGKAATVNASPSVNLDKASLYSADDGGIPDGVKGWSWGAFFLNWIWAIGNRSWIGLLALVPYVGWIMAFWLGFKGREMAWKNKQWDSLEHFNRVQRKWSQWGVGITVGAAIIGILAAIAAPAYQDYTTREHEAQRAAEQAANAAPLAGGSILDSNADNLPTSLRTVAGQLERKTGADGTGALLLDGQALFTGEDARWQFPLRSFTLAGGKEAILIASSGGRGNSCETLFYFLLADASGVTPTPLFGTCAAQGSIAQRGDTITIKLPDVNRASTIVLQNGVVRADGQVVSLTGMNDPSR